MEKRYTALRTIGTVYKIEENTRAAALQLQQLLRQEK